MDNMIIVLYPILFKRCFIAIPLCFGLSSVIFGQDFSGKVFVQTEDFSNDRCAPRIECDCCASEIIFTSTSYFVMVDRCIHNDTFYKGTYVVSKDQVELKFQQSIVSESYDETNETSELIRQNTNIGPLRYSISTCSLGETILQRTDLKVLTLAFRLSADQEEKIKKELKDRGVLELLR
jgi:hypothetical protein